MEITLSQVSDEARYIRTYYFTPKEPVQYQAGQFTELFLSHDHPDARGQKHWFTLSSSPTESRLSITTKFVSDNSSTFKQSLHNLKVGTILQAAQPMGDFVLPKDPTIPLVFIAGGIGVTPFRSIIKYVVDSNEQRSIHLIYSARTKEELAFHNLFSSAPIAYTPVITEPDKTWAGEKGPLDAEKILKLAGTDPRTLYYISGPEPMVEAFRDGMVKRGIEKRQLVADYFPGYAKI